MIINTGSRTDIPAFFSNWFYRRIKEGFVLVRNPYNATQVTKYRLSPDVVDCISFCTKNPAPMIPRLQELDVYRQFWCVTITPYGTDIEANVPPKEKVLESFQVLSLKYGVPAVSWRYDPIFINDTYHMEFHLQSFREMAKNLAGYTDHCVISFIDLYEKTKRNFPSVREVTLSEQRIIAREFVKIGAEYGIRIKACCESDWLEEDGVDVTGCMTQPVIERAIGSSLRIPKKKAAREGCECLLGSDIGAYNTCSHGCVYCYANYDQKSVVENRKKHNPYSPLLIGELREEDIVHDAKQESFLDGQMRLFDW